jgi:preprotein translocase SecF subunit
MYLARFLPKNPRIDFVGRRFVAFAASGLLLVAAVVSLAVQGLNLGIDFRGGILLEAHAHGPFELGALRRDLADLGLGEVALQEFGAPDNLLIRVQRQEGGGAAQLDAVAAVRAALGEDFEIRRTEVIGPKVSRELLLNSYIGAALAMVAIAAYVALRFEWQFSVAVIAATAHDVVTMFGLFSVLGLEFSLTAVAAILTIAGYSVNDTIVVMDRVRENLRRYKKMDMSELINLSVNQTLSRTILTGGTTILAIVALLLFAGPVLFGFNLALLWGIVVGTFSSIYVAGALLLYMTPVRAPEAETEPSAAAAPAGPSPSIGRPVEGVARNTGG